MTKSLMRCKPIVKITRKISKNKPEIMAVSGGVMILAAFGWAIYEAVGLKDTLIETSDKVQAVEDGYSQKLQKEMPDEQRKDVEKQYKKDLTAARIEGAWLVGKRFVGPTVTLIIGMGLGTKGFKILRARNVFLGTALKSTEEAYKFYRNNVREDLGADADLKYARGIIGEKEISKTVIDENGKEVTVSEKVPIAKKQDNPWRFEFSDTWFRTYTGNTDSDLFFIKCEQEWWNHELNNTSTGVAGISMYDILHHMGYKFEVNKEGMTPKQFREFIDFLRSYGWRKGSKGDGYIDLGIYRAINEPAIRRMSDVVWVEMNCDGPLLEI